MKAFRSHYIVAIKALQRAFVETSTGAPEKALAEINTVLRESEAFKARIEAVIRERDRQFIATHVPPSERGDA